MSTATTAIARVPAAVTPLAYIGSAGTLELAVRDGDLSERFGVYRGARVEITHGLASGDQVVTRGQTGLIDGALISPRNVDGSPVSTAVSAVGDTAETIP